MSGYVPKRVRTERTAMGSTDANSSGKNGHSIVSTIGRRSTLLNKIQSRSFGSMWQINYLNAAGNKCERERLVPVREKYNNLTLTQNIDYTLTIFNSKNTTKSFMNSVLYNALVAKYPSKYSTDRYCACGAVNNNVQKIFIGPTYTSNNGANTTALAGKEIVAIGRWQDGNSGWGNGTSIQNGESVYVAFNNLGAAGSIGNIPHFKFNGVIAEPSFVGNNIIATNNFQGVTTTELITIVIYGPGAAPPSGSGPSIGWLDDIFNSGFDALTSEKKITLQLV